MEHEDNGNINYSWNSWNISKEPGKETKGTGDPGVWRPFRPQHYWDWLEYGEVSWWPEETCCHLDFSEFIIRRNQVSHF